MNTQPKLVHLVGFLNVVLDHTPAREMKKVLHVFRGKRKASMNKKLRPFKAENRQTLPRDITADLKQLPKEELQNVLAYVRERKRQCDALQGA